MDSHQIALMVIDVLDGRGGFDGWWGDIDEDIKDEIRTEIASVVHASIAEMERDTLLLEALRQEGVDNWDGWGFALSQWREWLGEKE